MTSVSKKVLTIGLVVSLMTMAVAGLSQVGTAQKNVDKKSISEKLNVEEVDEVNCADVSHYSSDLCVGYRVMTAVETPVTDTPGGETDYTFPSGTPGKIVGGPVVKNDGGERKVWMKVRIFDKYSRVTTKWLRAKYLFAGHCDHVCIGDVVKTTADLNVREYPYVTGDGENIVKTTETGEEGVIVSGPVKAQGYRWWKVKYEDGTTGWSAENWFEETNKNADEFSIDLPDVSYEKDFRTEGEKLVSCYTNVCVDEKVHTTDYLNVRKKPETDSEVVTTVNPGTEGKVLSESVYSDGYLWYKVEYDDGTTGWSAANWFKEYKCTQYCVGEQVNLYDSGDEAYIFKEPAPKDKPERNTEDSRIIKSVDPGQKATVISAPRADEHGIWWKVKLSDGTTGWVPGWAIN